MMKVAIATAKAVNARKVVSVALSGIKNHER